MGGADKIYKKLVKIVSKHQKVSNDFVFQIKCKNTDALESALHILMYNYNSDIVYVSSISGNVHTIHVHIWDVLESGVESRFLRYE
jgi:hypothetical protein